MANPKGPSNPQQRHKPSAKQKGPAGISDADIRILNEMRQWQRNFRMTGPDVTMSNTPAGCSINVNRPPTTPIVPRGIVYPVRFSTHASIRALYLGSLIYPGNADLIPLSGWSTSLDVYIYNSSEEGLSAQWPTQPGETAQGQMIGSFVDPATQVTLPLILVDHISTGPC